MLQFYKLYSMNRRWLEVEWAINEYGTNEEKLKMKRLNESSWEEMKKTKLYL